MLSTYRSHYKFISKAVHYPQEFENANKASIATRRKMRLSAKTGSIKTRIKVSAKKMSELSEPFAAY